MRKRPERKFKEHNNRTMRLIAHIENGGGNKNQLNQLNVVVLTNSIKSFHKKISNTSTLSNSKVLSGILVVKVLDKDTYSHNNNAAST
jgi:hypothetical protein